MEKKKLLLLWLLSALVSCGNPLDFTNYHSSQSVSDALTALHSDYPGLTQIVTIGTSWEGRPIEALKISSTPTTNNPAKGDVVFVGCHHAREWMSVEVPLYIANQLLAAYATDPVVKADIDNLQIWIIPVVNPDGFAYTQTAGNRLWRKNRRDNGDGTYGVDLNRNYSYQWALNGSPGNPSGSPSTADDTYYGPYPFSEPELTSLRDFMSGLGNLKSFFSYHSFGEWHMKPWAYTFADAPGVETLHSIATRDIAAISAVHGVTYKEIFTPYNSSGEADDYWWNNSRIAALTTELRPDYSDPAEFSPDPSQIIPCAEENLAAAKAIIHDASRTGLWIKDYPADDGSEPSAVETPSGWSHEFWVSPDIFTVPAILNQGATVGLHVHVRNNTGSVQNNVEVDVYYTDPRISLEFPNPVAVLIGSQIITVSPSGADITLPWIVPVGTNSWGELHWCVGVVIKQSGDMPLTTLVNRSSNIGCRNFNTQPLQDGGLLTIAATNFLHEAAELRINFGKLPQGWSVTTEKMLDTLKTTEGTRRKALLLGVTGPLIEPGETIRLPLRVHFTDSVKMGDTASVSVGGMLIPLQAGKREAVGNGYTFLITAKR